MNATRSEIVDNNHTTRVHSFGQDDPVSTMVGPLFQQAPRNFSWFGGGDLRRHATHVIIPNPPHHSLPGSLDLSPTTASSLSTPFHFSSHNSPPPRYYGINKKSSSVSTSTKISASFRSGSRSLNRTRTYVMSNRRREQCRTNQARYRRNQERKLQFFTEAVCKLKEEIPVLKLQRNRLLTGSAQSVFNVIVEYFHLFQYGILSPKSDSTNRGLDQHQVAFLRAVAAPNISLGDQNGVDALLEQWRAYSSSFDGLHFQLEHLEEITKNFVVVSAALTVTVVEESLKNVFPHLQGTSLGDKILGQRLVLPCSVSFEWDEVNHQLVRLEMIVNFFSPITRALGSLVESDFVLRQARITRSGSIMNTKSL